MSYIAERRQDHRRKEIVEAAEDLYREMGWDAVTMDGSARLSRALVYVYFKDKQDLHFAIAWRARWRCSGSASRSDGSRPHGHEQGRGLRPRVHWRMRRNSRISSILRPAEVAGAGRH